MSSLFAKTTQGSGIASPKQGTNSNPTSSSTSNHAPYNRQRSLKHNSGSGKSIPANGGFSQLSSAHPVSDSSSRDNTHRDGGQRGSFGSQSHSGSGNEHQPRNTFRRGNGGPHPRGDGSHHHGYGGRRGDQDRANQDWNPNRGFGGRDAHMQPQRAASRPFMRGPPPPTPAPFIPPPPIPVRHFGPPVIYPGEFFTLIKSLKVMLKYNILMLKNLLAEVPSPVFYVPGPHPESVRAVPLIPPIPPMFFTLPDPQLHTKIVNQIDYYFRYCISYYISLFSIST